MVSTGHKASDVGLAIARVKYHGWRDCYAVTNGVVEAIVVPAIGRIMQFGFSGNKSPGVFWENRELDGVSAKPSSEWSNFGGDKAWPAPQGDWERVAGRAWPPPPTFDSLPIEARVQQHALTLSSPVDPHYGVKIIRHVAMRPGLPEMTITTRYCKLAGAPVDIGVWIVTQLRDPQRIFALLPDESSAIERISESAPMDLRQDGRLLSLRRDPVHNVKIAMEGDSLLWMDNEQVLRIDGYSASDTGNACRTSVYTNMDPLQYVELETESRVTRMSVGDHLDLTNTYTLARRSMDNATAEGRSAFALKLS